MRRTLTSLALAVLTTAGLAEPEPYLRVREIEETGGVSLQIAVRTLERGLNEPTITLVGVAHVGSPGYYGELQELLDAHTLVLYEGVAPMWAHPAEGFDDDDRAAITDARLRALAIAAEQRRRAGERPETLEDLLTGDAGYDTALLHAAFEDGWGRPMQYTWADDGPAITSLGADGEPGGSGPDADRRAADLPPLDDAEITEPEGIQAQLAGAARVVFQLDAINYDRPNWRNSDTTAEALGAALAGRDPGDARPGGGGPALGGGDPLFDLMSGQGMVGKIAGGLLKMLGSSPRTSAMLRLMLIETLGQADTLMGMTQGVEGIDRMMEVLLEQRNDVVLGDLERASAELREAGEPGSIAVFYGAAHLADIESTLAGQGYKATRTEWYDALEVDPAETGMSPQQVRALRTMVGSMLESQMRTLENAESAEE